MMTSVKAELKKVLTVRSTYAISLFFLILLGIASFYGQGYKLPAKDINQLFLAGNITMVSNITSVAGALIALLLMAHEYRYNTIVYSLTAANRRSKLLASKVIVIMGFVFVYSIVAAALSFGLTILGAMAAGHSIPPQDINYLTFLAKVVFFCESYALVGLLVPTLVRNMQASVAILFIVPNTLEQLLGLVIKDPEKWLPFMSLAQVVEPPVLAGPKGRISQNLVSPEHGAVVFLIYLLIGWAITWYLFLRRDAS
jgi:ABC-type transport system involved in multi-copper enzyme maturation permease subunit